MKSSKIKIIKCSPRGFCAGVARAIQIVDAAIEKWGTPIYVRHEIVHNKHVVAQLKQKGVVFIDSLEQIPAEKRQRPVIFSAHGVAKKVIEKAHKYNIPFIDAVCPLVSKVHKQAKIFHKNGAHILLIGHKGHPEVQGTIGQVPKQSITLIENKNDAQKFQPPYENCQLALITQTTLSIMDTKEIIDILQKRFQNIQKPSKQDICYATTNRQNAIQNIAPLCDAIIVVGAENSSNSCRLVEVAKKAGCQKTTLITNPNEVNLEQYRDIETLGISAGASAPEFLIEKIIENFQTKFHCIIEEQKSEPENIVFRIPPNLRSQNDNTQNII